MHDAVVPLMLDLIGACQLDRISHNVAYNKLGASKTHLRRCYMSLALRHIGSRDVQGGVASVWRGSQFAPQVRLSDEGRVHAFSCLYMPVRHKRVGLHSAVTASLAYVGNAPEHALAQH